MLGILAPGINLGFKAFMPQQSKLAELSTHYARLLKKKSIDQGFSWM